MKQINRRILSLLLALVLVGTLAAPVLAADSDVVHIQTSQDLVSLSRSCSVDSWSVGKTVYLDADIDLAGSEFQPIPIFRGTFDGQGHTISGFSLSGSGNDRGFFRYVQPGATIQNLTVKGTVSPSDRKDSIGGLVGVNRGKLLNCSFIGNVKAGSNVGGLVGYNKATGQLINCSYSGTLLGEHYVGGIAGQNEGSIIRCRNDGDINITEVKTTIALHEVNLSTIRSTENAPACTDIGGIAGASSGILQSCTNTGDVGYEHVGYNVGGIAGRQSGWLDSCVNSGTIRGRKDVGGICGQMEPRLTLLFEQSSLDELWDELDTLQDLMDQAISHAEASSQSISQGIHSITDSADQVKSAASDLSDALTGWTDENIETINDVSARISWTIERLEPIADSVDAALDRIQHSANLAGDALDEAEQIGSLSEKALTDIRRALDQVDSSAQLGSDAVDQLRDALEQLKNALGDSGAMDEAMGEVREALDDLTAAFGLMSDAFADLWQALGELYDQANETPDAGTASGSDGETSSDGSGTTDSVLELPDYDLNLPNQSNEDLDWSEVSAALEEMGDAAEQIKGALETLGSALGGVGSAAGGILLQTLHQIAQAAEQVTSGLHLLDQAAGHVKDAFDHLDSASSHGERAAQLLKQAAQALEDACQQLSQAGDTFRDVMSELADKPEISFTPIGDAINKSSDILDAAIGTLGNAMEGLNESISTSSDILLADLRAINNQFGKVIDVLRRQSDHSEADEDDEEDLLEDVSDQATETDEDAGRITNGENFGTVEGDVNVAGIVGSMAIEYDYDPEDDLTTSGDRSLDFHYQAAALTEGCVNNGQVTGKKDYIGGIVGRMDLGTVSRCESYVPVESSGGDYVGGIAGAAWSTIRSCWTRCSLSGVDYIGGVAGSGKTVCDCRCLVEIDNGSAYLGAVLGYAEEGGEISGNLFTHDTLNGIGGVSYLGQAEPVNFDTLSDRAPDAFTQFRLVFMADGEEVSTFAFSYGDALPQLPDIPEKEGFSASWPDLDYNYLTFSRTLEAEYTAYTTALTAIGNPPQIVAEGTFSSDSTLSVSYADGSWTDAHDTQHIGRIYTVAVTDPLSTVDGFQVHYKMSDSSNRCAVWVETEEGWVLQESKIDGSYLVFRAEGSCVSFTVEESDPVSAVLIPVVCVCAAAAVLVIVLIMKKRRHGSSGQ